MRVLRMGTGMSATVCPMCKGEGTLIVPRAALTPAVTGPRLMRTAASGEPCKTCRGVGYLPGLKPPV